MRTRAPRTVAVLATALTGLLGWGATPAAAAENAPPSWESSALGLPSAQRAGSQGEGVTVAVLDSGVNRNHPALKGRVSKVSPDIFDSDGLKEGDPKYGIHGTAMASDVLKVAPKAKIISARVIDDVPAEEEKGGGLERQKGDKSAAAQGIDFAVENGADVISMSFGSVLFPDLDEDETAAIGRALQAGITLIAAPGNSGGKYGLNDGNFPAGYAGVISVAATAPGGSRAEFSTMRTHNTVAAPGVRIVSAKNTGGYYAIDGTSPAAALASGVVALMRAKNADLTPAQVRAILMRTAQRPAGGHDPLVGAGQINAAAAVRAAGSPPKVATGPVAYKGKKTLAAPSDVSKVKHPPLETELVTVGGIAGGVGVLMLLFGALLLLRRRRSA
ncbi:S8 family serine peptidase [Streptomyces sp. A7024]|uniref:S8 family serine peptidase n=1 Tax=Streptomyces coryli TaxID=1128680 RepID=A0A6G4UCV7_9ACTN|nr:S8 family serine peptidase [Streptomyces coryli]